jgi:hypothetical protein
MLRIVELALSFPLIYWSSLPDVEIESHTISYKERYGKKIRKGKFNNFHTSACLTSTIV